MVGVGLRSSGQLCSLGVGASGRQEGTRTWSFSLSARTPPTNDQLDPPVAWGHLQGCSTQALFSLSPLAGVGLKLWRHAGVVVTPPIQPNFFRAL